MTKRRHVTTHSADARGGKVDVWCQSCGWRCEVEVAETWVGTMERIFAARGAHEERAERKANR